jgi:hypothetical protein
VRSDAETGKPTADEGRVRRTIAERLFCTVAWVLPTLVALSRLAPSGRWESDVPALRDLALVSVGLGGGPSTALTQIVRLLPLGSLTFRAALVGVFALAISARILFEASIRLLRSAERERSAWLAPTLAAVGTLTTTLGPSFQREATVGGGRLVAIAALLGIVLTMQELVTGRAARRVVSLVGLGVLLAIAFSEDVAAGLLGLACLVASVATADPRPGFHKVLLPRRAFAVTGVAFGVTLLFFVAPPLVRAFTPGSALDFGLPLSSRALGIASTDGIAFGSIDLILREIGWSSLGLFAMGVAAGLIRRATRWQVAPLLVFVAADVGIPLGLLRRIPLASVTTCHLAAVFVICIVAVSGVHAGVRRLLALRIPFAKPLAALSVAFHITLVALISEQAGEAADRSLQRGAEEWTDSALGDIDPSAAILVRSPQKLFRIYEAQLVEGARPDVVVVPVRLLGRGSVSGDLLTREREIEPLVRSIALTGSSDEFSLSKLADVRPLFVELDKAWDTKETSHLTISGLWLRFAPEPLAAADRKMSSDVSTVAVERLLASVAPDAWPDPSSVHVAEDVVRQEVTLLVRIGDTHTAGILLSLTRKAGARGGVLEGASIAVRVADIVARMHDGHAGPKALEAQQKQLAAEKAAAAAWPKRVATGPQKPSHPKPSPAAP